MARLIVGISGASGVIYGIRLLQVLAKRPDIETHLVLSKPAERTIVEETDYRVQDVKALASVVHPIADIGASIASGSFQTLGMAILPCSIHTASAVAYCHSDNLLTRAADVVLKERRTLVLVIRETPLHLGHLKALVAAAESGAIILPPIPAFYGRPTTLDEIINHTVGRVLDHFGVEHSMVKRWGE
ncbi:MAG TPA: UbiX family flavin prenyltransferase [Candidatus Limnocylindria bacterium]|jgi:4-hydroxy-3-polyprenylbenzoate decarboxylase|nr:UbiX family flavin prenyltransferase [Candidatus Limnocylindria bacterium]